MIKSVTVFVLDGFIIEGNVLERTPLDEVKVKAHPFKRHYLAILVSIAVHFLLAFLLFFFAEEQQPKQVKITQKAIKSYLYKMPSKKVTVESLATKKVPEKNRVKKEWIKIRSPKPQADKQSSLKTFNITIDQDYIYQLNSNLPTSGKSQYHNAFLKISDEPSVKKIKLRYRGASNNHWINDKK